MSGSFENLILYDTGDHFASDRQPQCQSRWLRARRDKGMRFLMSEKMQSSRKLDRVDRRAHVTFFYAEIDPHPLRSAMVSSKMHIEGGPEAGGCQYVSDRSN